jgi:hypothetical protein
MPDENEKQVPIDTSGPDAEVEIEETKDESVVETGSENQETSSTDQEQETVKAYKLVLRN